LALIAAAALVFSGPDFAVADERRGAAQVQDGDTLVVAGEKIRLLDVDAPALARLGELRRRLGHQPGVSCRRRRQH
jgi:endonuclease YncB( thermonuclease family)